MAERTSISPVVAGSLRLPVNPEQLKGFFEVVGAYDRYVPLHRSRQLAFLVVAEIPRILEEQPSTTPEWHLLLLTETTHFTVTDFDRIVEVLDDVEPVEQDLRLGRVLFTRLA